MFLLDTDTIIYSLKGSEKIAANLKRHMNDPLSICVITLMELYYGAYKSQKVESNLAKIRALENAFDIIPIGTESIQVSGLIKSKLEKRGKPLDDFDIILASVALTHNLTLVTNNTRHFQRIEGLSLANWTGSSG